MTPEEFNRKFRRAFWSNAIDMLALLGSKPEDITKLELITRKVIAEMTAPGEPLMNGYPSDFEFPPAEKDVLLAPHNDERIGGAYQDFAREQCPSCEAKAREVEVVEREGRTLLIFADEEEAKQAAEREEEAERLKAEEVERLVESMPKL